jgi:cytochrome oxidase Cu insertion factor (SCO1/SenC/PrrC family)
MTSGHLEGSFYLLYFGFTFCPDICPNELVKMSNAIDLVGPFHVRASLSDAAAAGNDRFSRSS